MAEEPSLPERFCIRFPSSQGERKKQSTQRQGRGRSQLGGVRTHERTRVSESQVALSRKNTLIYHHFLLVKPGPALLSSRKTSLTDSHSSSTHPFTLVPPLTQRAPTSSLPSPTPPPRAIPAWSSQACVR